MHRWEEIRIRQHRLLMEAEHQAQPGGAHLDHIMKSGFTMNDLKGLQRNYSEDGVESDEVMRHGPQRPSRASRRGEALSPPGIEINGEMHMSDPENAYSDHEMDDDRKKRGRSPFRLFGKKRDQSKDKLKDRRTPEPEPRKGTMQQRTVARSATRVSNTGTREAAQMAAERKSMGSPQGVESFGNEVYDADCLKLINEYFYGVRIFPGQDPTHVYVGWVTTQYHVHSKEFNQDKVRHAAIYVEDESEKTVEV